LQTDRQSGVEDHTLSQHVPRRIQSRLEDPSA
jgi:hypothetical protein